MASTITGPHVSSCGSEPVSRSCAVSGAALRSSLWGSGLLRRFAGVKGSDGIAMGTGLFPSALCCSTSMRWLRLALSASVRACSLALALSCASSSPGDCVGRGSGEKLSSSLGGGGWKSTSASSASLGCMAWVMCSVSILLISSCTTGCSALKAASDLCVFHSVSSAPKWDHLVLVRGFPCRPYDVSHIKLVLWVVRVWVWGPFFGCFSPDSLFWRVGSSPNVEGGTLLLVLLRFLR